MLSRNLVMMLTVSAVVIGTALTSNFAAQPASTSREEKINTLLRERRDVLAKIVETLQSRWQGGNVEIRTLFLAQSDLLNAELELAKTHEERIGALKLRLENCTSLEKSEVKKHELGVSPAEDVLFVTAERMQAEIQFLRELASVN